MMTTLTTAGIEAQIYQHCAARREPAQGYTRFCYTVHSIYTLNHICLTLWWCYKIPHTLNITLFSEKEESFPSRAHYMNKRNITEAQRNAGLICKAE